MKFLWNLLAIIGLVALIGGGFAYSKFKGDVDAFYELDPSAGKVYSDMWTKLKETGNSADATVWKKALEDDVSPKDAEEAMDSAAVELGIMAVGKLPLSVQVEKMTGKKQRFLKIFQYCNPITAMTMVDHSDAFAAYLPCRISMIEDKQGKFWLYALDMDMMISGGKTLPDKLLKEATKVKAVMLEIMARGASGEF
ncbi:MAG TPA: DUF302 domain-containing protein [Leucothrix mucor]|uniref:DUF302 domain-containing protein n=1 Tax=Leucothrix mucor TaxID=45248 RepID=A0A7V2T2J4_LEUMU|nr:DUF302 domain-containing protein [Leucothrix mucor]